jgi:L-asparaginase
MRPKVYCLYTGGTIGCAGNPLAPLSAEDFAELVASQPGFTKAADSTHTLTLEVNVNDEEEATIDVVMDDIQPAIDSSSMSPSDWVLITQKILKNYSEYHGIVVLHGTDTMAFTASAVSYMLALGVSKPVIFTGSQVPLSKTRNDAQRNLVTSITIAATQTIHEVALYFDSRLFRGNRSVKVSSSAFHAFESPNHPPLGKIGIEIRMEKPLLLGAPAADVTLEKPKNLQKLQEHLEEMKSALKEFSVITITLHPGIRASSVRAHIQGTTPPCKGIILQAYGAGNAPADDDMLRAFQEAHDEHGVVICDITQIVSGGVDLDAYESAAGLKHAGAVSGYDLTAEAALTKLVCLIARGGLTQQQIEESMKTPFQGDLSHDVVEQSDAYWKALYKKRGPGSKVLRLLKKRKH